jgi:hypothetical protein
MVVQYGVEPYFVNVQVFIPFCGEHYIPPFSINSFAITKDMWYTETTQQQNPGNFFDPVNPALRRHRVYFMTLYRLF